MIIDLARALSSLIVLSVAFSAACGGKPAKESTVYIDVQKVPLELRDEYASFATNCSKCHGLSRALNAPVTDPKHWDLYVARMMRTAGSAISPKEGPVILRFLHWYTLGYNKESSLPGAETSSEPAPDPTPVPEPFPAARNKTQAAESSPASPPVVQTLQESKSTEATSPPAPAEAPDVTQTIAGEDK